MTEHMCCITRKNLTKTQIAACRRIAKANGYSFTFTKMPGTGWQGWFSGRNYGFPFDRASERAIRADIASAGLEAMFA